MSQLADYRGNGYRVFRLMASYFFLRGQEKVTKKKATPTMSACGCPAMLTARGGAATRPGEPHKTRLTAEL